MTEVVEVYRRTDDLWEWRRLADNGQVVATSGGQGYTRHAEVILAASRENPGMEIREVEGLPPFGV